MTLVREVSWSCQPIPQYMQGALLPQAALTRGLPVVEAASLVRPTMPGAPQQRTVLERGSAATQLLRASKQLILEPEGLETKIPRAII